MCIILVTTKRVVISKIRIFGKTNETIKQALFEFKGYGAYPLSINYELAFKSGKITNPNAPIRREEAIEILTELSNY